jgi:serine/threonine protein kinase
VKILDFGLAKLISPGVQVDPGGLLSTRADTVPGVVLGSLGYMAPEASHTGCFACLARMLF